MTDPRLVLIGGANGAGKSTLANVYIRDLMDAGLFLNADEVARRIAPENQERAAFAAGRSIVRARRELLDARVSFAVESTLASLSLLQIVIQANGAGYLTRLIFLFTATPQINEFRVKQRVMQGGHNVDTDTIRRRHRLGLRHLPDYVSTGLRRGLWRGHRF
ncbi:MAG TPA: zeta toxin family protein [Reyranella sp.]|nr:zeta toxin family protein [Reyranella sp.]